MLVTNLAYRDMEAHADGLTDAFGRFVRRLLGRAVPAAAVDSPYRIAAEHRAHLRLVAQGNEDQGIAQSPDSDTGDVFRWRRHPQLLNQADAVNPGDIEDLERRARSAAVRGLFLARSGRLDEARSAFAVAATEPAVDLTAIPGFWELTRSGMLAAVGAYEEAGRFREASALGARIRLTYRPRPLAPVPGAPVRRESASGT